MTRAEGSTSFSATIRGLGSTPSPIGWRPMCSTPPAMATSIAPNAIERGGRGDGGHRAGAHAVDRSSRGWSSAGRPAGAAMRPRVRPWSPIWVVAAMATSSTRSGGRLGVAAHQLADAADDEVVGAGLGVHALLAGLAERGADAVDEHDLTQGAGHGWPPGLVGVRMGAPVCRWVADRCYFPVTTRSPEPARESRHVRPAGTGRAVSRVRRRGARRRPRRPSAPRGRPATGGRRARQRRLRSPSAGGRPAGSRSPGAAGRATGRSRPGWRAPSANAVSASGARVGQARGGHGVAVGPGPLRRRPVGAQRQRRQVATRAGRCARRTASSHCRW